MQTFLPYKSFEKSAKCLDYRRLGKQRVEAWQIYQALTKENYGWKNHPIVKMWKGYELSLLFYGAIICEEWRNRKYKDNMLYRFVQELTKLQLLGLKRKYPSWIGDVDFHDSHKSNLLRKDKEFYSRYNWNVPDNLPYIWRV